MKLFIKRHWDILTLNIIGLLVGVILYLCLDKQAEILVAVLATTISLSIGIRTYNIEDDKIFMELFQSFNAKYDDKFNDILNSGNDIIDKKLIVDYLNLCAEEYLWYKKKRIPDDVWTAWRNGMLYHFEKAGIKKIIIEEMQYRDSYYGLFDEITLK